MTRFIHFPVQPQVEVEHQPQDQEQAPSKLLEKEEITTDYLDDPGNWFIGLGLALLIGGIPWGTYIYFS